MTANLLQRQVDAVIVRIYCYDVRMRGSQLTNFVQALSPFVEDRDDATLRSHVQPVEAGVQGEHVRVSPNALSLHDAPPPKVEPQQRCIPVAGHERGPARSVD